MKPIRYKMANFIFVLCFTVLGCIFIVSSVRAQNYPINQITSDNSHLINLQINDQGQMVWCGNRNGSDQIFYYSNGSISQLTNDLLGNGNPQINNQGEIVWDRITSWGSGNSYEIYYYNGSISRITNNSLANLQPKINDNGQIIYSEYSWYTPNNQKLISYNNGNYSEITDGSYPLTQYYLNNKGQLTWGGANSGSGVYVKNNGINTRLPNSVSDTSINDIGQVAYIKYSNGKYQVFKYDINSGIDTQITNNNYFNSDPQINNYGQIVWQATGGDLGNNKELYSYINGNIIQISNNNYDRSFQLNDIGQVVWAGSNGNDSEIYLFNKGVVTNISNNSSSDTNPRINNIGQIAWQGYDGSKYTINTTAPVTVSVPMPTNTPPITAFPETSKLFTDSVSFMKNYQSSFSSATQQFFNDYQSAVDRFLLKDLSGSNWKFAFSFGEEFSKNLGTAFSLLSLVPSLEKGAEALAKNDPGLAKAYFTGATLNFANWTGKQIIYDKFNSDYDAKLALDSAQALASAGIGAITGTLNPYTVLLTANGIIWGDIVASQFSKLANDPPDSDFCKVFQAAFACTAPFNISGLSPDLNTLLGLEFGSLYNTYYFMQGLTTSIDRYGSALAAGDAVSAALQFEAFVKYLTLYDSFAIDTAYYLKQFRLSLINQGIPDTGYNRQAILDLQNWIRLNGMPQELIDYYRTIGLTDDEIMALVQTMLDFIPPDSISGSLYSNLLDASNLFLYESSASPVPIPSTILLLGSGLLGMGVWRRFRKG